MSESSNDKSDQAAPLRVGVIADAARGAELNAYFSRSEDWELVATAGSPDNAWPEGVSYYDDRRVMLAQSSLDAVVVADSTKVGIELGDMAVRHGLPIWRYPPLGRSFGEACEQVTRIRAAKPAYCVASHWRRQQPMLATCIDAVENFQPQFSEVRIAATGPSVQTWRAGKGDAGGGVALLDAYEAIEILIALRGIPDNVSAATGHFRRHPNEAARETEDVATAIFRYDSGGVAVLNLTWDLLPEACSSRHHGATQTLEHDGQSAQLLDFGGEKLASAKLDAETLAEEMDLFAGTIRGTAEVDWRGALLDRHLAVNAVIEALYLSAQTWQPELPRRLYEVQGWHVPNR